MRARVDLAEAPPMSAAAKLLDRLDRLKQTAPACWLARCPAHEDHSPSLSIRALDDGRLLLHCFAGCGTDEVLAALGLQLRDLYPKRLPEVGEARSYPKSHSRIPARDLLEVVSEDITVVALLAADFRQRRMISEDDWKRLAQAAARIGRARDHVR
jgi:hypothetical protein